MASGKAPRSVARLSRDYCPRVAGRLCVTNEAVCRFVHIAGDRNRRFRFYFWAVAPAALLLLCPRLSRAQAPIDLPDAGFATDATPAPPPVAASQSTAVVPPVASGETIVAQVGTRVALRVENPNAGSRDKLNDAGSEGEADVVFWGKVHPYLGWQAGFIGSFGFPAAANTAALLDLVAKLEIVDALNLWVGRMPIPSDRASLSTVWGIAPWTLPGRYDAFAPSVGPDARPAPGPRQFDNDRGDGATLWGQIRGGRFKYYLGVFGLDQPNTTPLYSGRLALSLLNPEPGFRSSSTYFGNKDILAVGVGAQHQTRGSLAPAAAALPASDFNELNADLLFEKNGGMAGVLNVEGALAKLWGKGELASYQFFALVSYLVPIDIGIGRFQPLVRLQHAGKGSASAPDAGDFTSAEAQLGYIIDGFHARLLGVYQYAKVQGQTENAVLFGLQLLSHTK